MLKKGSGNVFYASVFKCKEVERYSSKSIDFLAYDCSTRVYTTGVAKRFNCILEKSMKC